MFFSIQDLEPMGVVNLQNCCACCETEIAEDTQFTIRIEKQGKSVIVLRTTDQDVANKWAHQINAAANKLTRVRSATSTEA